MRMPGFTADVSRLPACGRYSNTLTVPNAPQRMVVPQLDAVSFFDPFGFSYWTTSGGGGFGYTQTDAKTDWDTCNRECGATYRSAKRQCRFQHPADRADCIDAAEAFFDSCADACDSRYLP